jgi:spermidine synthase
MVDIDQEVVELSRDYLPNWSAGAFCDPRTELRYLDARRFLEETNETYDIIIIDISEPVEEGPAYLLYTKEFYALVMDRLTPDGIISLQAGTTSYNNLLNFKAVYQTLKQSFPIVSGYQAIIPSFGLPWGFAIASKRFDPRDLDPKEIDRRIAERIPDPLRYYDGALHQSQFVLPKPVRIQMEQHEQVIEDNHPLFTYN